MAASCTSDPVEMEAAVVLEEGDGVVIKEEEGEEHKDPKEEKKPAWKPHVYYNSRGKERFHFAGKDITIHESLDFHGNVLWPAASALCHYLETNREQFNLMDKYVLELGAGTGLVSIVAAHLGAWVTSTDLPEILGNLRYNLLSNTRGRCKYLPQVVKLSWSEDLDRTFPKSVYHYDYILATDVVYFHEHLDDLLVTMKHFCQPGTKLIWANKVRLETDLLFTEKFKETFNITFLADVGEAKIFMATIRDEGSETHMLGGIQAKKETEGETMEDKKCVYKDGKEVGEEEQKNREEEQRDERNHKEECHRELTYVTGVGKAAEDHNWKKGQENRSETSHQRTRLVEKQRNEDRVEERTVDVAAGSVTEGGNGGKGEKKEDKEERQPQEEEHKTWVEREMEAAVETGGGNVQEEEGDEEVDEGSRQSWEEQTLDHDDEGYEDDEETENTGSRCSTVATDEDLIEVSVDAKKTSVQEDPVPSWAQTPITRFGKDIYFYAGQEIGIHEGLDTYGAVMWPAALALCHFLDTNPQDFNLKDKTVLELGAGTGIVSIVASLLGASVMATDLPDIMANLRCNLSRNTNGRSRHTPQVAELSWGHNLEVSFPKSTHHYDYVLAADVVYHHTFLKELLATMKYFCRPGTKLLWANKVRFLTDLQFTEDFQNAFHTTLLAELGVVKIFMAMSRG